MSEWAKAIYEYVSQKRMPDRECNKTQTQLFMCCGKLRCFLCYNWHKKWIHASEYVYYVDRSGNMIESKDSFYPDAVKAALFRPTKRSDDRYFIDQLSEAELLALYNRLKVDKA